MNALLGFIIQRPKADRHHRLSPFLLTLLSLVPLLLYSPSIVHAQWEPDVRLSYNDSASYASPRNARCVAAGPSGLVFVVWYDERDMGHLEPEIYCARSTNWGATWFPETRLTYYPDVSFGPSVSVSNTTVHVVWTDKRRGIWKIYYKCSTNEGLNWSPDTCISDGQDYSRDPSIISVDTIVHVTWADFRNLDWEIYYKRSTDAGVHWSPDVRLSNVSGYSEYPSIGASGSNVQVAWDDNRDGNYEIYTKRSTDYGLSWSPDTRLTNDTSWSQWPSISISGSDVHIGWDDYRSGYWLAYYKRSTDGGLSWSADRYLPDVPDTSGSPSVFASGSNVHVVWDDYRTGTSSELYYKRSWNSGETWSPETRLTYAISWSGRQSLWVFGPYVHVAWEDWRGSNPEIYYKRNPTGNGVMGHDDPLTVDRSPLTVYPNPFTSFTTLPGHEAERFALYNISGRKVGVWKGDRVGEGLSPGVYFLRPEGKDAKPLRIVKLR